jgi:hypothetical protein
MDKNKRKKEVEDRRIQEEKRKLFEQRIREVKELRDVEKKAIEVAENIERTREQLSPDKALNVINFVSDKNGCGYYRSILPLEILSTYCNAQVHNTFIVQKDPDVLKGVRTLRFQRQATRDQRNIFDYYKYLKAKVGYHYRFQYEMDDLLMEIDPSNKIAYDFFDEEKKQHHLHMMRNCDKISFSTQQLLDVYVNEYGMDRSKSFIITNNIPQFLYQLPRKNQKDFTKEKIRILWSGSASHIGPNGDMSFMIPLVKQTLDEYQWIFQGCIPPELQEFVDMKKIEFYNWAPIYGLANVQFYVCRPDIILAPLKASKFNQCKSDLKFVESCALGAPMIGSSFNGSSWTSPYELNPCCKLTPTNNIDEWKTCIDQLKDNPDFYKSVVEEQYTHLQTRWLESQQSITMWFKLLFEYQDMNVVQTVRQTAENKPQEQLGTKVEIPEALKVKV